MISQLFSCSLLNFPFPVTSPRLALHTEVWVLAATLICPASPATPAAGTWYTTLSKLPSSNLSFSYAFTIHEISRATVVHITRPLQYTVVALASFVSEWIVSLLFRSANYSPASPQTSGLWSPDKQKQQLQQGKCSAGPVANRISEFQLLTCALNLSRTAITQSPSGRVFRKHAVAREPAQEATILLSR